MIPIDVISERSVTQAVQRLLARAGRIDIVLNHASFGIAGAVEDCSIEEAQRQFDTDFSGLPRACHQPRPRLRHRIGPLSQRLAVTLKARLPQAWFEAAVRLSCHRG